MEFRGVKRVCNAMDEDTEDNSRMVKRMNVSEGADVGMYDCIPENPLSISNIQALQNVMGGVNNLDMNQWSLSQAFTEPALYGYNSYHHNGLQYHGSALQQQLHQQRLMNASTGSLERQSMSMAAVYNPSLDQSQNPHYYESNRILFELYTARIQRHSNQQ